MPVDLKDIELYAGDPKTIVLRITGQDRTSHAFSAQLRHRAKDATKLADFTVTKAAVANAADTTKTDTVITLELPGDSAVGVADGATRFPEGVRSAYFDVQESIGGKPYETIAFGRLVQKADVTR